MPMPCRCTGSRASSKDSLTYKAMQYTLNQWERLTGYCADGRLTISNALAENAIRPFAIGCLEPFAYLHYVLQHIGAAETVEQIEALLPWNAKLKAAQ
jgi:hypothetical protein